MTADELMKAAMNCKCVTGFHPLGNDRMPAAFVASMQFSRVVEALPRMRIYKPEPKRNPRWKGASKQ